MNAPCQAIYTGPVFNELFVERLEKVQEEVKISAISLVFCRITQCSSY
jgi:hypothetical protein